MGRAIASAINSLRMDARALNKPFSGPASMVARLILQPQIDQQIRAADGHGHHAWWRLLLVQSCHVEILRLFAHGLIKDYIKS
jgi:hypothetical protein